MDIMTEIPRTPADLEEAREQFRTMTAEVERLRDENQGLAAALEEVRGELAASLECREREKAQARHIQLELQGFIEVLQKAITAQAVELAGYMGEAGVVPE